MEGVRILFFFLPWRSKTKCAKNSSDERRFFVSVKKKWAQLLSYPPCLNKVWSMKSFHVDTMWRHINWFPLFYYLLLNCIMNSRLIWYVDIFSSCFVVVFHDWWNKWKKINNSIFPTIFQAPFSYHLCSSHLPWDF